MDKTKIIENTIKELLEAMKFNGQVVVDEPEIDNILVNIQTEEAGFLIGQDGANLDALQHLSRILVNKKNKESIPFVLDVNDYRKHRIELLKDLAKNIAQQALTEKVSLTLQPMSAYERRVIHLALINQSQISTESIGQEPERRIVVRPIE
ncbi:KH domain-containing protein [Patescibacteria group bacterium]|nr:KH domain-containing protein [Patescibacteria group bacterium]MBU1563879.1 KH domain-containing protein [Patescibacteria group bacterium]